MEYKGVKPSAGRSSPRLTCRRAPLPAVGMGHAPNLLPKAWPLAVPQSVTPRPAWSPPTRPPTGGVRPSLALLPPTYRLSLLWAPAGLPNPGLPAPPGVSSALVAWIGFAFFHLFIQQTFIMYMLNQALPLACGYRCRQKKHRPCLAEPTGRLCLARRRFGLSLPGAHTPGCCLRSCSDTPEGPEADGLGSGSLALAKNWTPTDKNTFPTSHTSVALSFLLDLLHGPPHVADYPLPTLGSVWPASSTTSQLCSWGASLGQFYLSSDREEESSHPHCPVRIKNNFIQYVLKHLA